MDQQHNMHGDHMQHQQHGEGNHQEPVREHQNNQGDQPQERTPPVMLNEENSDLEALMDDGSDTPEEEPEDLEGTYSRRGEFSKSDVVAALDFAQRLRTAPIERQDIFSELMGVWGNHAEIIFALYPSGGRIEGIEFITEVYAKNHDENMSRADIRQWGMEFGSRVGDMDPERIRMITKMLNALTPEDYPELRYRRNMSAMDTADLLNDAIDALDQQAIDTINWASDLLAIWPAQAQ